MYFPSLCFCIPEACDGPRAKRQPAVLQVQLRKHRAQAPVGGGGEAAEPTGAGPACAPGSLPAVSLRPQDHRSRGTMGTFLLLSCACALTRTSGLNDRAVLCTGGNDR